MLIRFIKEELSSFLDVRLVERESEYLMDGILIAYIGATTRTGAGNSRIDSVNSHFRNAFEAMKSHLTSSQILQIEKSVAEQRDQVAAKLLGKTNAWTRKNWHDAPTTSEYVVLSDSPTS